MKAGGRNLPAWLLAILLFPYQPGPLMAADQPVSREQAQLQLKALEIEISALQKTLEANRSRFSGEQQQLRKLDLEIQRNSLALRDLADQRSAHQEHLGRLERERAAFLDSLGKRKEALNAQVISAYQLSRESRLKLLLNQDSPERLSRLMAYYDYINAAQSEQIAELREVIESLDAMQSRIDAQLLALNDVEQAHQAEAEALGQRRSDRVRAVEELEQEIGSAQARLAELQQNRLDLESLLGRLEPALADIPTEIGDYRSPAELRGELPMPVSGRVLRAFGQKRVEGLNWQGWLIGADAGTEVAAIAYGRVAYADWLRGYGLLMIIDHGDGIMSLYGHNESLLHGVGDWVFPGAAISVVGTNPGVIQGLYFELRSQGKPVDPASWLRR